jgi:hypothetical protein
MIAVSVVRANADDGQQFLHHFVHSVNSCGPYTMVRSLLQTAYLFSRKHMKAYLFFPLSQSKLITSLKDLLTVLCPSSAHPLQ